MFNNADIEKAIAEGKLVKATPPEQPTAFPPIPTYPAAINQNFVAPLPATSWQQPDQQRQWQNASLPQIRISPLPASASLTAGAAAASQAISIVNSIPAPQADTDAAATDGLIHGDPIWVLDPAYVNLRDEFITPTPSVPTALIGQLSWNLSGSSTTPQTTRGLSPSHMGEYSWANVAANNQTGTLSLCAASEATTFRISNGWALMDYPGWEMNWIWRFHRSTDQNGTQQNFGQKSMYIGLGNSAINPGTAQWTRPAQFIGCRYDTSATAPAISDSTLNLEAVFNGIPNTGVEARNNTQGTVVNTGITPTEDAYYRLTIKCVAAGVVTMSLNGSAPSTFNVPQQTITMGTAANGVLASLGQAYLVMSDSAPGFIPFQAGSIVTIAGLLSGNAVLNGVHTLNPTIKSTQNNTVMFMSAANIANNSPVSLPTVTGYPGFIPVAVWGNDDTGASAINTDICIDFFSFVWNPGVIGLSAATPDPTKSRYF